LVSHSFKKEIITYAMFVFFDLNIMKESSFNFTIISINN